jgi:hypothetical protein
MQVCTKISEITVNVCVVSWCVIFRALAYAKFCRAFGKPRELMMSFNFPGENKENNENLESG